MNAKALSGYERYVKNTQRMFAAMDHGLTRQALVDRGLMLTPEEWLNRQSPESGPGDTSPHLPLEARLKQVALVELVGLLQAHKANLEELEIALEVEMGMQELGGW